MLEPLGHTPADWRFNQEQLRLCKRACRLQRDLGLNAQGIGLSMQLLEEIERLRRQLALLEGDHDQRF